MHLRLRITHRRARKNKLTIKVPPLLSLSLMPPNHVVWCVYVYLQLPTLPLPIQRFASVVMRIRDPKTTALIFASGKIVCTGAKSEKAAKEATRKYAKIIQKLDFPAKFKDFKIQNVVASVDLKFPIRLEGLAYGHGAFSQYEPELFPGLVYRMIEPKVVLLIFVSGKVVFTGAKEREHITAAFKNIYPLLRQFQKKE